MRKATQGSVQHGWMIGEVLDRGGRRTGKVRFLEHGFLAVDVTIKGWNYCVFNAHLEQRLLAKNLPERRLLQVGQAYELLSAALATWSRWDGLSKTVIVIGDMNSDPSDTTPVPPYPATLSGLPSPVITPYAVFTHNGFTDAWTLRSYPKPDLTC